MCILGPQTVVRPHPGRSGGVVYEEPASISAVVDSNRNNMPLTTESGLYDNIATDSVLYENVPMKSMD